MKRTLLGLRALGFILMFVGPIGASDPIAQVIGLAFATILALGLGLLTYKSNNDNKYFAAKVIANTMIMVAALGLFVIGADLWSRFQFMYMLLFLIGLFISLYVTRRAMR